MSTRKKIKEFFVPPPPKSDNFVGLMNPASQGAADMATLATTIQTRIDTLSASPKPAQYTYREWFLHQVISYQPDATGALPMKANDLQVGGEHYKHKTIQPWDAITAWQLGFLDGNAVKYLARWRKKNGLQDLRKAQHYVSKLIEEEELRLREIGVPIPAYGEADTEVIALPPAREDVPSDTPADAEITQMAERLAPAQVKMKTTTKADETDKPKSKT